MDKTQVIITANKQKTHNQKDNTNKQRRMRIIMRSRIQIIISQNMHNNNNKNDCNNKHLHFPKKSPPFFQYFSIQQIINIRSRESEKPTIIWLINCNRRCGKG